MADVNPGGAAPQTPQTENARPSAELLDPAFLRYLEQLEVASRKTFLGRMKGERRSKKRGVSIEFADYREYSKGDDLRFLDWNIFGRLDRLFTKLFHEEEDLYLYILVDSSKSMDLGDPNKGIFAKKIAAALAYVTLAGMDRVCLVGFDKERYRWMQPARGKYSIWRILNFLDELPMEGETSLADACKRFVMQQKRGGVVILLSDLFDPEGYEEGLKRLLQNRNELYVLHTLSPQELNPELVGSLRLLDAETDEPVEISVTEELLGVYQRRLKAFQTQVSEFSLRYGVHYQPLSSDAPVERLLTDAFRRLGLVA